MFWLGKTISPKRGPKISVSPIEYIILLHLRRRELLNKNKLGQYGKELIDELNSLFAGSWEAKSGTIYPILSKLDREKDLLISEKKKSPLGPRKKVYTLTDKGRELIDDLMRQHLHSDIEFMENYSKLLVPFQEMIEQEKELIEEAVIDDTLANVVCVKCGKEIPYNAKFCPACGELLMNSSVADNTS